jgi:hypothetical protein
MEGTGVMYGIDPNAGTITPEIYLRAALRGRFGNPQPYFYMVVAYNDMPRLRDVHLIGLGVFGPLPGHGNSAWYVTRDDGGHYELHEIASLSGRPLIAARTIVPSPFPEEQGQVLYIGGYDTNKQSSHNTAWIYRVGVDTALAPGLALDAGAAQP